MGAQGDMIGLSADLERRQARLDAYTHALKVMNAERAAVTAGELFSLKAFADKDTAGTIKIGITTPDSNVEAVFRYIVDSTLNLDVKLYRDAEYTVGTAQTPLNNNENSSETSDLVVVLDPTVSNAGNLIESLNNGAAPFKIERENPIVLKKDTVYLLEITSNADSNTISYDLNWTESIPKN